jgi:hypothetical protein
MLVPGKNCNAQQASLDLQEKCSSKAESEFAKSDLQSREQAVVTNHYNVKLDRCFIEIDQYYVMDHFGNLWNYKTVSDAYEGKIFGSYAWKSDKIKKYWEVKPTECKVMDQNGQDLLCNSDVEFDNLIKIYMQ